MQKGKIELNFKAEIYKEIMCDYVNKCCMLSSGYFPGVLIFYANISEHSVCSMFIHSEHGESVTSRI